MQILLWEKSKFKNKIYIFLLFFFSRFESLNYSGMCVKRTNQWKNRFFPNFFHRIFGQFTWLNGILVLRKTMIITENYTSEFGRRRKKNTSSIWCFIQIIDSHRTIKYNETSASHSCAEKKHRETNHRKAKEWKTEQLHPISHREKKNMVGIASSHINRTTCAPFGLNHKDSFMR